MLRFVARLLAPAIFIGLLLASVPAPASAAVTGALLTTSTPSYSGSCPTTLTFTGTITGSPGTTFKYSFNRFIDGVQQIQDVGNATIPVGGSLPVSDSFSISSTSAGVNFDQIWVHNIVGGQSDVYSPRAAFNVTCTTGGSPTGGPGIGKLGYGRNGHTLGAALYGIPMPTNLKSTTDPQECGRHGGLAGLFCIQAVPDHYLILVWDWQPNDKWPSIDGYHIYDVTGGGKTHVQDQTNPQATVEFFKPGSFAGKCYAVSAYKGATESETSISFCTSNVRLGTRSKTLPVFNSVNKEYTYHATTGLPPNGCLTPSLDEGVFAIGWYHHDANGCHLNIYWRTYVQFDPNQIVGLNVYKARLKMHVHRGDPSCFGAIGTPDRNPFDTQDMIGASWLGSFGQVNTQGADFDVTSVVRDWARGATNWGFAFKGNNEDTGAEDNGGCTLEFENAVLSIDYY